MGKVARFFLSLGFLTQVFAPAVRAAYVPPTAAEINEAKTHFKFRGKWIPPLLVDEFMPPGGDPIVPTVLSADLAVAVNANRFYGEIKESGGRVSSELVHGGGEIVYEWKGRLKNGKHVLLVRRSLDGTLVTTYLLVFSLRSVPAVGAGDKAYTQLVLELNRMEGLGDRAQAEVSLRDNKIDVKVTCEKTCDPRSFSLTP